MGSDLGWELGSLGDREEFFPTLETHGGGWADGGVKATRIVAWANSWVTRVAHGCVSVSWVASVT